LAGEDEAGLRWRNGTMAMRWSQLQRAIARRLDKGKRERRRVGWADAERETKENGPVTLKQKRGMGHA
jgi:hypothetical protein